MRLTGLTWTWSLPILIACLAVLQAGCGSTDGAGDKPHHHRHHHKKGRHKSPLGHHKKTGPRHAAVANVVATGKGSPPAAADGGGLVSLATDGAKAAAKAKTAPTAPAPIVEGTLTVHGNPSLPADFQERFYQAAAKAVNYDAYLVASTPLTIRAVKGSESLWEITFRGPENIVNAIMDQAADPNSQLTTGPLHDFLVDSSSTAALVTTASVQPAAPPGLEAPAAPAAPVTPAADAAPPPAAVPAPAPTIDVDTAMPYGDIEPFGREDTAQELTESSVQESDEMVDQLERAEVAEEKRAVFRALTRLRGAAITSFDGIARSQTGNIDEYAKTNKWRNSHPLAHLAAEESDVSKWAFPTQADF